MTTLNRPLLLEISRSARANKGNVGQSGETVELGPQAADLATDGFGPVILDVGEHLECAAHHLQSPDNLAGTGASRYQRHLDVETGVVGCEQ